MKKVKYPTNINLVCTMVSPKAGARDTTMNKNRDLGCISEHNRK